MAKNVIDGSDIFARRRRNGSAADPVSDTVTAAVAADRARYAQIMALSEAVGREPLARQLANTTNESVESVRDILATAKISMPEPAGRYAARAAANNGLDSLEKATGLKSGIFNASDASKPGSTKDLGIRPEFNPFAGETETEILDRTIQNMPHESAQKVFSMSALKDDARALQLAGYEAEQDFSRALAEAKRNGESDSRISILQKRLAEKRQANEPKNQEFNTRVRTLDRITKWLSNHSFDRHDVALRDYLAARHEPVEHERQDQGNIYDFLQQEVRYLHPDAKLPQLSEARKLLDDIRAEIKATIALPGDRAEAIDQARNYVMALAQQGEPDILRSINEGARVHYKRFSMDSQTVPHKTNPDARDAALAIAAWMDPDAVMQRMTRDIMANLPEGGISSADRAKKLGALRQAEARAEYLEVWAHDAEIGDFLYREGLRVEAMLGIEIIDSGI